MWFNNLLVYPYDLDLSIDLGIVLSEEALKPCPPHARFIYGWLPVLANQWVDETADYAYCCMGKEERILPRGVIHRLLTERIEAIELQQGRTVRRSERAQLAEDLEFELLPKAFCLQKRLPALFDPIKKRLLINTASPNQASQVTALLRKSVPTLQLEPLQPIKNIPLLFSRWISDPHTLPASLQLGSDCLLFSLDDESKRMHCKGYELPADEVLSLLSQGLVVSEISLIWNEHIQFTLTHELSFKRIKCLDLLTESFHELHEHEDEALEQQAALTLLSSELRKLLDDVLGILTDTKSLSNVLKAHYDTWPDTRPVPRQQDPVIPSQD